VPLRLRPALIALLAAAALAGVSAVATLGASPPPVTGAPQLTLALPRQDRAGVRYDTAVVLSGRVTNGAGGVSGVAVQVQFLRYPFLGDYLQAAVTTTAPNGRFRVTVHPQRNTHYRAVLVSNPAVKSATQQLFAYPQLLPLTSQIRKLRATVVFQARAPMSIRLAGDKVSFYYAKGSAKRYRHVADALLHSLGAALSEAVSSFALPGFGSYKFYACLHTIPALGRPQPSCGSSSLPR